MRILTAALLSCLIGSLVALEVGDTAPPLDQAQWIKGEAPDFSQQVTVVEFWATWCAPCLESIPHLTALQENYGDQVAIVGLSDEPPQEIEPFLAKLGEQMDYRVGSLAGQARFAYMAGVPGIPYSFIVGKDGKVLWHGSPMAMDRPLAKAVSGSLDPDLAKRLREREQALQQSIKTRDLAQIKAAAQALLEVDPAHPDGLFVLRAVAQQEKDLAGFRSRIEGLDRDALDSMDLATVAELLLSTEDLRYRLLDQAVEFARRAKEAAPEQPGVVVIWAHARYLVGDIEGAIAEVEQALEQSPDHMDLNARLEYYRQAKELGSELKATAAAP